MRNEATWSVVSTVADRPDVILTFAAHHVHLGAHRVHLYLDHPDPDMKSKLEALPRCVVTLCDDAHWARVNNGVRPKGVEHRQIVNADHAFRGSDADWMAHVDCDEFISSSRPLGEELAHIPAVFTVVRLDVRERVFLASETDRHLFSGAFRKAYTERFGSQLAVLGETARFSNGGLVGHTEGKCLVRTCAKGIVMGIHRPRPVKTPDAPLRRQRRFTSSSSVLLHFDGLTQKHWIAKVKRYAAGKRPPPNTRIRQARNALLDAVHERKDDAQALMDFAEMLKTIPAEAEAKLFALGLIERPASDPLAGLAAFGLEAQVDLSPGTFDRHLAEAA